MYAHKVIEDFLTNFKGWPRKEFLLEKSMPYLIKEIFPKIIKSKKIHFDDYSLVNGKDVNLCHTLNDFNGLRLPFQSTWFDWIATHETIKYKELGYDCGVLKTGVLCEESNGFLKFTSFSLYDDKWIFVPIELYISTTGKSILENENFLKLVQDFKNDFRRIKEDLTTVLIRLLFDENKLIDDSKDKISEIFTAYMQSVYRSANSIHSVLKILECKNIILVDEKPPEKLNKKRIKNGKEPIHIFKTLMIKLPKTVNKIVGKTTKNVSGESFTKLTDVIGHQKTYTEDAPLFGKYVGKWWWQGHERGNIKNGKIEKDYNLIVNE